VDLHVASICDRGLSHKRPVNEDRALVLADEGLFVVCDGVGGHSGGEVASQLAVDTIEEALTHHDGDDVEGLLERAVRYANRDIFEMASSHAEYEGMGTTVALLYLDRAGDRAIVGHAGDSRVYRYDGRLHRETYDHTDLDDAVRSGRITAEQALNAGKQNTINRALGIEVEVQAEFKTLPLVEGEAFLLCSDGVTRHVDDDELEDLFRTGLSPDEICEEIRSRCYTRGAEDNLTAIVVCTSAPVARPQTRASTAPRPIELRAPSDGNRSAVYKTDSRRTPFVVLVVAILTGAAAFAAGRASVGLMSPPPLAPAPAAVAREAFERGDYPTARARFATLVASEPSRADYHFWLGRASLAEGDARAATAHLSEAVRLDPTDADAFLHLAAAHQLDNQPALAVDALRKYAEAARAPNRLQP
jgi:protein phosphatase